MGKEAEEYCEVMWFMVYCVLLYDVGVIGLWTGREDEGKHDYSEEEIWFMMYDSVICFRFYRFMVWKGRREKTKIIVKRCSLMVYLSSM